MQNTFSWKNATVQKDLSVNKAALYELASRYPNKMPVILTAERHLNRICQFSECGRLADAEEEKKIVGTLLKFTGDENVEMFLEEKNP